MLFPATSIAPRLAVRLVVVTSLVVAAVGALAFWSQDNRRHRQLAEAAATSANQLSAALSLPVWNFQAEVVNRILDSAMEAEDVAGIVVNQPDINAPGGADVFARTRNGEWRPAVGSPARQAGEITENREVVYNGKTIGSVALIVTPRWIDARLRSDLAISVGLILLIDLVLVCSLYTLLRREIITPLQVIGGFANQVTTGGPEPARPPPQRFHGELDGLRASIETMVRLLQSRYVALQESEELFRTSFESATVGMCLVAPDGKFLNVNRTLCQVLGYAKEELLGLTYPAITHEEDREIVRTFLRQALAGGPPTLQTEKRYLRKDGRLVWAFLSAALIGKSHDHGSYLISHIQDITERKRAELELLWKTAFLEAQVDSSLDGILVVDDRAKRILQNQRFLQLFKVPEAIARDDDQARLFQHALDRVKAPDNFRERVAHLYAHPDLIGRDEIELMDGTILDRYSSPVRDKAGKYFGRIWVFRDITEQRALELQYRQSQKMEAFGQLAGGVAHDFNNILAVIQLYAGLLSTEAGLPPQLADFVGEIEKAAQRAANLTRQLLLFSRQHAMQARDLDLQEVVENLIKMLQRTLGAHIGLKFQPPGQPLYIHADAGMMDQILLNLAVNARDAMPRGGQILIAAEAAEFDEARAAQMPRARPGSFVCLSVADTGSGIPPEILPRIFEPFFTTKEVGKGTGLGLATVFGIVQQHKGWIQVRSEVGRGTVFQIYLPRLPREPAAKPAGPSPASAVPGSETILVVEDEPALRTSVRLTLTGLGYRVLEAETGAAALTVWRRHRDEISLLLTDLVMPGGMTGKELGDCLLADNPRLKVVYVSGYSADMLGPDFALKEGVDFLIKPFTARRLAKIIRDNLGQSGPNAPGTDTGFFFFPGQGV